MRYLILLTLCSCATWKQDVGEQLENIHRATSSVVQASMPIIDSACRQAAVDCADSGDEECQPLIKCDMFRRQFAVTVISLYHALVAADAALAVGDEDEAWRAVKEAVDLMGKLRETMREIGLRR